MYAEILFGDIAAHFDLETIHGLWRTCHAGVQLRRDFTGTYAGNRFVVTFRGRVVFYVNPHGPLIMLDGRALKLARPYDSCFTMVAGGAAFNIFPRDLVPLARVCKVFKYDASFHRRERVPRLPYGRKLCGAPKTQKYIYTTPTGQLFESDIYIDSVHICGGFQIFRLVKIENAAVYHHG